MGEDAHLGEGCRALALAKLNLCLSVAGPEPAGGMRAGWHRISSWFAAIDLCDEVVVWRLREGEGSRYRVRWSEDAPRPSAIDWAIEKDLAVRAHLMLQERVGRALPIEMEVVKRIPVGGGLGGGSSDAAAALVAVDHAFGLGLGRRVLGEIGMRLGSDVGYFVGWTSANDGAASVALANPRMTSSLGGTGRGARAAVVEGFGDRIEAVAGIGGRVTLVMPAFGCATPDVYRAYDTILSERGRMGHDVETARVRGAHAASVAAGRVRAELLFNDLLDAAERVRPELNRVREAVGTACGLPAHLTGSGSCLFVVGAVAGALRGVRGLEGCVVAESSLVG